MSTLDELTPQQQIDMADKAAQLVRDPAFKRAIAMVNQMYYDEWRSSDPADATVRERLYLKAVALDDVVSALATTIGTAKITASQRELARIHPIRR